MAGSSSDHLVEAKRAAGLVEPKMWIVYVCRLNHDKKGNVKYYVWEDTEPLAVVA